MADRSFFSVPERGDAQLAQIVRAEGRQHLGINVVLAEQRLTLLQPERAQPVRDVHRHFPKSDGWA
jgi:hypothetical protein